MTKPLILQSFAVVNKIETEDVRFWRSIILSIYYMLGDRSGDVLKDSMFQYYGTESRIPDNPVHGSWKNDYENIYQIYYHILDVKVRRGLLFGRKIDTASDETTAIVVHSRTAQTYTSENRGISKIWARTKKTSRIKTHKKRTNTPKKTIKKNRRKKKKNKQKHSKIDLRVDLFGIDGFERREPLGNQSPISCT
eukprot:UN25818